MHKFLLFSFIFGLSTLASAQTYIYDNLKAKKSTSEVYFTGKWCNASGKGSYGNKAVESCTSSLSEYVYMPNIGSGVYGVYIRWTADRRNSDAVPVTVRYTEYYQDLDGNVTVLPRTQTVFVNQRNAVNGWSLVGNYTNVGGSGSIGVMLSNANGQANTDGASFVKTAEYSNPYTP